MTREIIEKISSGDHLTDEELDEAIIFYGRIETDIRLLGEKFFLPWAEVRRVYDTLRGYRYHRNWGKDS